MVMYRCLHKIEGSFLFKHNNACRCVKGDNLSSPSFSALTSLLTVSPLAIAFTKIYMLLCLSHQNQEYWANTIKVCSFLDF